MDDLLKLIKSTEKLLARARENLNKIGELKLPSLIERTSELAKNHNDLKGSLASWKESILPSLVTLAREIGDLGPFRGYRIIPEIMVIMTGVDIGTIESVGGGFRCIPVDLTTKPPEKFIGFCKDIIEAGMKFLRDNPKATLDEINQLSELVSSFEEISKRAKLPKR